MSAAAKDSKVTTAPISLAPQTPIVIPGTSAADGKTVAAAGAGGAVAAGAGAAAAPVQLKTLFPAVEPYKHGRLQVSKIHNIYWELCGNPQGKPVIFLHGGPGGGIAAYYRQYFDPKVWNVLLFDQRGSGQSTPFAGDSMEENTTWDLVADIEKLREMMKWESAVVFGGSWGSTLALAYAETHPQRVKALVLRGIFALRDAELKWFYQDGASWCFPDAWEKYIEPIPLVERNHLMSAYHRRLNGTDKKVQIECARAWSVWEMATSRLFVDPEYIKRAADDDKFALAFARIENHYFVNGGWFATDNQLIDDAKTKISGKIPGTIVQGRYDMVCPMKTAWDLHRAWPEADFVIVPDAGHSVKEPGITDALIRALEKYQHL